VTRPRLSGGRGPVAQNRGTRHTRGAHRRDPRHRTSRAARARRGVSPDRTS